MRGIYVVGAVIGAIGAFIAASMRRGTLTLDLSRFGSSAFQGEVIAKEEQTRAELASLRRDVLNRLDDLRSQLPRSAEQPKIETEMNRIRSEVESMEHELLARLDALRSEVGAGEHAERVKPHTRKSTRPEGKSAETRKPGS